MSTNISASNAPKTKMFARSASQRREAENNTSDLAAFLRESAVDADPKSAPAPVVGRKASSGEGRNRGSEGGKDQKKKKGGLFGLGIGRRKTYLEM